METVVLVTGRSLLLSRQGPPITEGGGPPPRTPGTWWHRPPPVSGEGHGEGTAVYMQAGGVGRAAPRGPDPLRHGHPPPPSPSLSLACPVVPGRAAHAWTHMHASLHSVGCQRAHLPGAARPCPRTPSGPCPRTSAGTRPCMLPPRERAHVHVYLPVPQPGSSAQPGIAAAVPCRLPSPARHGAHGVQSVLRQSPRLQPRGRLGEASVLLSALGVLMR